MTTQELSQELNRLKKEVDDLIDNGHMIDIPPYYGKSIAEEIEIYKNIIDNSIS